MQRLTKNAMGIICGMLALFFLYLAFYTLQYTSILDPERYGWEHILWVNDDLLINMLLFILGLIGLRYLSKLSMRLPLALVTGLCLAATFFGGSVCALVSNILPVADQAQVYNAAAKIVAGNWRRITADNSYFQRYSFQLGQLLYTEGMQRLFGPECYTAIRMMNVFSLTAAYAAILSILWQSLQRRRVQACASILLTLFAPGVLYVTFIYGNLLGLALALWGAEQCCRFIRSGKKVHGVLGILLLSLATIVKINYLVFALAVSLASLLFALHHRRLLAGIFAVCTLACPFLFSQAPLAMMEARTGVAFDKSVPQSAWLVMGMQEGPRASGWYNGYVLELMPAVEYDQERAREKIAKDLEERLTTFMDDPAYGISFFRSKLSSQWAETTYESIWVNRLEGSQSENPSLVDRFFSSDFLPQYMDTYGSILYALFAAGLLVLAKGMLSRKHPSPLAPYGFLVLVISLLGGLLYHMLFEAKSQYLVVYIPLMIPIAAYGLMELHLPKAWLEKLQKKKGASEKC